MPGFQQLLPETPHPITKRLRQFRNRLPTYDGIWHGILKKRKKKEGEIHKHEIILDKKWFHFFYIFLFIPAHLYIWGNELGEYEELKSSNFSLAESQEKLRRIIQAPNLVSIRKSLKIYPLPIPICRWCFWQQYQPQKEPHRKKYFERKKF